MRLIKLNFDITKTNLRNTMDILTSLEELSLLTIAALTLISITALFTVSSGLRETERKRISKALRGLEKSLDRKKEASFESTINPEEFILKDMLLFCAGYNSFTPKTRLEMELGAILTSDLKSRSKSEILVRVESGKVYDSDTGKEIYKIKDVDGQDDKFIQLNTLHTVYECDWENLVSN